jgi:putative serine protease PepD
LATGPAAKEPAAPNAGRYGQIGQPGEPGQPGRPGGPGGPGGIANNDRSSGGDTPKKRGVSRGGAWSIGLVSALVAASLAAGGTYYLTGRDSKSALGSNTPVDTTTSSAIDGLTSGKNVPEIPAEAYDGEVPQWEVVASQVSPTVVALQVSSGDFGEGALGSGVIINSEKGYVVTNNHVVADASGSGDSSKIDVVLSDGRIFDGTVLGTDPSTDLAIVELTDPPSDLVEAELGDSDTVVVGEPVMAVGNPLGLDNTATTGIVSALNRPVQTSAQSGDPSQAVVTNAIQIDAAVNPGNSGGPLFNSKGQVIGINSSIATLGSYSGESGSIGLGFAIPSNQVQIVAGQLIEKGAAAHPFLGVTSDDTVVEIDGVKRAGARLESVQRDTPATGVGLVKGDVIVAVNGNAITGSLSLTAWIRSYQPGDQVTLTVVQGGEANDVQVTLTVRDEG